MISKHALFSSFILVITFIATSLVFDVKAQNPNTPDLSVKDFLANESETESKPRSPYKVIADDYNRGQPRSTMAGYLNAVRSNNLELAANYLDYRNISKSTLAIGKEELARQLGVVLHRILWVDLGTISDESKGHLDDSLPSYRELVGNIKYQDEIIKILLQRIPREKDRVKIWKISNATVEKIPLLFKAYSYSPVGEWLAKNLPAVDLFGVMLWQWLYFSVNLVMYLLIAVLITWSLATVIKQLYPKVSTPVLSFVKKPVTLLLAIILVRSFRVEENVTLAVQAISEGSTLFIIAWCWILFHLIDIVKLNFAQRFVSQDKPLAVYLLRPAGTVCKLLIVLIAMLHWLENLGFNASTLLAGLGIGGLALALAAQKTVENIIGAITLYTSAPVKIGDFCHFGNYFGVVEEIGLRSTRVRTIDRTVVYIANAKFIEMEIENFSEREKIIFKPNIFITPESSGANIEALVLSLREHFSTIENIEKGVQRVHVKACTTKGIELYILLYVKTTNFDVYLEQINQLNLDIISLMAQHNCKLQVITANT